MFLPRAVETENISKSKIQKAVFHMYYTQQRMTRLHDYTSHYFSYQYYEEICEKLRWINGVARRIAAD